MALLTPDDVRAMMPKVGDELMRKPTCYHGFLGRHDMNTVRPCVVTYVHPEHLWYSVRFKESGIIESYKMPDVKVGPNGRLLD